jgi:acetate---CoA ligase (ADP-forming)
MKNFFRPKSIAVIGASNNPDKIGRIIFDQLTAKFRAYPINPKRKRIAGKLAYKSVLDVKGRIDLAVIAVPARFVIAALEDCGKKGIKNVVIVSSGFKEIGNLDLDLKLKSTLAKHKIKCVGPNCLGVYDAHSGLDSLFLPVSSLPRPKKGGISFLSQSGAVGSVVLDLLAYEGFGFAKFVSYGNATNLDETDYLEFLGKDPQTKVICMYIEGIQDGRKFLRVAKKIKKPIIVIKGGQSDRGSKATLSHTGSLAGSWEVYQGAFRQAGVILAETVEQMFQIAKLFERLPFPNGQRAQIITNGGGYGIITTDAIEKVGIQMAKMQKQSHDFLVHHVPKIVTISNPMDLVGDATNERYDLALKISNSDKNTDLIFLILLHQTPGITHDIAKIIRKHRKKSRLLSFPLAGKTLPKCQE